MARIVSLLPSATEIVCALGFGDSVVGRSHECDYPQGVDALPACTEPMLDPRAPSDEIHHSVSELLSSALSVYRVDAERLRALAPTHIVTQVQCEVCAVSLEQVEEALAGWVKAATPREGFAARALRATDAPAPELVALNPGSLEDVFDDIRRVASALGAAERGDALIRGMRRRLEAIGAAARSRAERPRVATIEWLSPLMAAGNWMPELVEIAGGVNVLGERGRHSPWLERSDLAAADPDVIAVFPCGFSLSRTVAESRLLETLPGWRELSAVREGRVYLCEGNQFFNRPGPRLVETAEILAEILDPARFTFGHEGTGWTRMSGSGLAPETET